MWTVDQKFNFLRDIEDLSRRKTQASTVIQNTVEVLNPFWKNDTFDGNQHFFILWGVNEFSDLFGEKTISEYPCSGVGLPINFWNWKGINVYMLYFVLFVVIFEKGKSSCFSWKNVS